MEKPPRTEPPFIADERTMLEGWLEYHRATLAHKCAGLNPEQLRERSVPPSSLSLLGLVRHMAEVERGWFRRGVGGEDIPFLYCSKDDPDGDFDNVDDADVDEAFASWESECDAARRNVAACDSLDFTFVASREPHDEFSLRWVVTHMIEEYARHNGHADFLRERIDGTVGE